MVAIALHHWGIFALQKFNGMFAFAWTNGESIIVARDRFGEVPVYYNPGVIAFASEQKALTALGLRNNILLDCGHYIECPYDKKQWCINEYYHIPDITNSANDEPEPNKKLLKLLTDAVDERKISDVPICTLLSGGIDSSLITAILAKEFPGIIAYTAVFNKKSKDLKCARLLADYLNIKLVEVNITEPTIEDIKATIYSVESYLKTQIEIAYPTIKLAEVINKDGFKVVFSSDGSDEMFGSYRFAYHGIKKYGYRNYIRKLYHSLSYKNYIRNNKAFMAHSVEARLPFANTELVEYVLNLPTDIVYNHKEEKRILKSSVQNLLPQEIIKRQKIGFQDGLGIKEQFAKICKPSFYRQYYKELFN